MTKWFSVDEGLFWSAVALRDCRHFGFDTSKWEQVFMDIVGEGINGRRIHYVKN
jgi:hypothetical protein